MQNRVHSPGAWVVWRGSFAVGWVLFPRPFLVPRGGEGDSPDVKNEHGEIGGRRYGWRESTRAGGGRGDREGHRVREDSDLQMTVEEHDQKREAKER